MNRDEEGVGDVLSTLGAGCCRTRDAEGRVTVDMGEPKLDLLRVEIPLAEADGYTHHRRPGRADRCAGAGGTFRRQHGQPALRVLRVDNARRTIRRKIGPMLEYHPMLSGAGEYQPGAGEVEERNPRCAFGNGAPGKRWRGARRCAATVAAARRKLTDRKVRVVLTAERSTSMARRTTTYLMTGPTELNFTGELSDAYFADDAS